MYLYHNSCIYPMSKPLPKKINIFLSLDQEIIEGYFNPQDPAPMYKRQLSHEFEEYIMICIKSAKRNSTFTYKISFRNEQDKQYADSLVFAIRRHFAEAKATLRAEFEKFKRRTYTLLFVSMVVVMVCEGLLPLLLIFKEDNTFQSGLKNSMDVLCWVILWKPIDRLIFYWNPYLKDISIREKLEKAEVVITEVKID